MHPFDLQARAALAAHSLTALLDTRRDGLMYFLASWRAKPPRAVHCLWDYGDGSGRHIDALTLARRMLPAGCAESMPDSGEAQLEQWMLRQLGEKGLSWLPDEPWNNPPWGADLVLRDWHAGQPVAEISWAQRGTLLGLTSRFLATQDQRYLDAGCRLVDGLLQVAVRDGQDLFFPEGYYRGGGWRTQELQIHSGLAEYNAAVLLAVVRFFAATRYPPALELAEGLARFALHRSDGYRPDGSLCSPQAGSLADHFHTRSNFILAVLELGLLTDRREYIAWARQGYTYARAIGSPFGWFPEGLGHRHGEVCCMTDMLEIALNLGLRVDPLYLSDAEKFGRNHLLESQFLSLGPLLTALDRLPAETVEMNPDWSTAEGVAPSQVGAFAARSTLNDAFHLDASAQMQCCNAAGTRGLYDLWRYAIRRLPEEDGLSRLDVNLRFSVETEDLRVVSHEPAEGLLDIVAARDSLVRVRLPQPCTRALLCDAQGTLAEIPLSAGYASFRASAGVSYAVSYPLAEREETFVVGSADHILECHGRWRGETLVAIQPQGVYLPLYTGRDADLGPVLPAKPASTLFDSLVSI